MISQMREIPVSVAKDVATSYGYDQVIIIARKTGVGGMAHCTTYGVDQQHCEVAARIGNFIKYKIMGWVNIKETTITGCILDIDAEEMPDTCLLEGSVYSKGDCSFVDKGLTKETCGYWQARTLYEESR